MAAKKDRKTGRYKETGKPKAQPTAMIYRHWDGYPSETGVDLVKFLDTCRALPDGRLSDPAYLAAKYVVWLADQFRREYDRKTDTHVLPEGKHLLDFLSVGIVSGKPEDWGADYLYKVVCNGSGRIECYQREGYPDGVWKTVPLQPDGNEAKEETSEA